MTHLPAPRVSPIIRTATLLAIALAPTMAVAAESDFLGTWLLALDRPRSLDYGTLEIERDDETLRGYVDGGPVPVSVEDDRINVLFDWDDGGGTVYVSELSGTLVDGRMTGEIRTDDEATGSWWATPRAHPPGLGEAPRPVELSGIWRMQTDDGTGKNDFDLTARAREFQAAFDPRLDDPVLRCVSDGLVRVTGGPFAKEIMQDEDKVTLLYEDMHEIRRAYLDRGFPEDVDTLQSSIGYSVGHWEGSTLVVETRGLKEALWHRAGGKPISSEARVTEYIYIGEDGNLHVELVLHDPLNYNRSPQRHTVWAPAPDYEFTYYDCDPDAFYRGMYLEDRLDIYFDRSQYRR